MATSYHPSQIRAAEAHATTAEWRRSDRIGQGGGEIAQCVRLLRHTRQSMTLFRMAFAGLDGDTAEWLAQAEFGEDGIVERLADGAVALLIFNGAAPGQDPVIGVARRLRRALRQHGVASLCYVELSFVERCTVTVGDLDELLAELSGQHPWLIHGTQA